MRTKQAIVVIGVALLTLSVTGTVAAQRGGGDGRGMTAEKRDAAWTLEATGVAAQHELSSEKTTKLIEAYKNARKTQGQATQILRQSGQRGPGMFQEMLALNESERSKFRAALKDTLSEEEIDKTLASLGTFNNQWDRLVDAFASFGLDDTEQQKGLNLITQYVVDSDKARTEALEAMDFQSLRGSMQTLKEGLDTAMTEIISAEQIADWKEKTAQRGRGGRGSGGGRPPQ